ELVEYLRTHSRMEVPDTVRRLLEDVSRKHGHIKMGFVGAYLRVDDPSLIEELKANKRFAKFIDRVVFPGMVALKTTDPEGLLKELRKAGYMPMWEGNPMPTRERGMGTGYVDDTRQRRRRRTE
ncbi:MAG: helicase-associated domain-containing protein, partial [Planctomycetota bacterium]